MRGANQLRIRGIRKPCHLGAIASAAACLLPAAALAWQQPLGVPVERYYTESGQTIPTRQPIPRSSAPLGQPTRQPSAASQYAPSGYPPLPQSRAAVRRTPPKTAGRVNMPLGQPIGSPTAAQARQPSAHYGVPGSPQPPLATKAIPPAADAPGDSLYVPAGAAENRPATATAATGKSTRSWTTPSSAAETATAAPAATIAAPQAIEGLAPPAPPIEAAASSLDFADQIAATPASSAAPSAPASTSPPAAQQPATQDPVAAPRIVTIVVPPTPPAVPPSAESSGAESAAKPASESVAAAAPDSTAQKSDAAPEKPTATVASSATVPTTTTPIVEPPTTVATDQPPKPTIETALFKGVRPGVTKLEEVRREWGEPASTAERDGTTFLTYVIEPFPQIQLKIADGVVQSLMVRLTGAIPPDRLTERLKMEDVRSVDVVDEQGRILGRAFPERGVLFGFAPECEPLEVAQVLIEPVDEQAFVLRAESHLHRAYEANLADLSFAVERNPEFAQAYWLAAIILLQVDRADEAFDAAETAVKLEPRNHAFLLTRADCLARQGDFAAAVKQGQAVLAAENLPPIIKARASSRLGDWLASGPARDYKQAVALHAQAIKLAEPYSADTQFYLRRAAKEVLLDAHLGMAYAIGWGNWSRKDEVVRKWVERATAIARDMMSKEGGGAELQLKVIERSLAAHAGFTPSIEPGTFLEAAGEMCEAVTKATTDELSRQQAAWLVGLAFNHALRIEYMRSSTEKGLAYGKLAQEHLEKGATGRESSELARLELGKLYFHLGALHAVHKKDHEAAVEWYGKAEPLLTPRENITPADPGRIGEMLVSMGVSYWEVNLKQKAIEATTVGVQLIETGVTRGTIGKSSLAVPYANLASMHQAFGDREKARDYSAMSDRLNGATRR